MPRAPVEIQPNQAPDPIYSLLSGTADSAAWEQARQLLSEAIILHTPGESVDANHVHGKNRRLPSHHGTVGHPDRASWPLMIARETPSGRPRASSRRVQPTARRAATRSI